MSSSVTTVAFAGLEARRVDVQVQMAGGLPGDETNGIETKRDSFGITLQPIHPGGISLSRAHQSYRNNE